LKKILLIEDNDILREQIQIFLKHIGYACAATPDGESGVALATEHLPDLVLCDVRLPTISGFDVVDLLKNEERTRSTPVIFMSALNDRESVRLGMTRGGYDYLTKPFTMKELEEAIGGCFAKYDRVEEKYDSTMTLLRHNLTSAMPHELRTPLLHIIGYGEMLYEAHAEISPADVREYAAGIVKSSRRLQHVVENYLVFSELESVTRDQTARQAMQRRSSVAAPIIQAAAADVAERYARKRDLHVSVDDARVGVGGEDVRRVIGELVDNAFKFSGRGEKVCIDSELRDDSLCVTIQDGGRGMAPNEVETVGAFMQFGRVSHEQQGMGLGLAIVIRLLDLYNGDITFDSKQGHGTRVRLVLPLTAA